MPSKARLRLVRPDSPPPSPWDSASPDSDSHGGARAMRVTTPPVWRGFRFWHGRLFLLPCPRMSNGSATRALCVPVPRPTHRQAGPRTPRCRSGRDRGALFGMGDPGRAGDPRRRSRRAVNGPSDHRDIESANGIKAARLCTNSSPGPDLLRAERGSCLGCISDGLCAGPSWPLFRSDSLSSANRSRSRGRIHWLARPVHRADLDDSLTPSRHSPKNTQPLLLLVNRSADELRTIFALDVSTLAARHPATLPEAMFAERFAWIIAFGALTFAKRMPSAGVFVLSTKLLVVMSTKSVRPDAAGDCWPARDPRR